MEYIYYDSIKNFYNCIYDEFTLFYFNDKYYNNKIKNDINEDLNVVIAVSECNKKVLIHEYLINTGKVFPISRLIIVDFNKTHDFNFNPFISILKKNKKKWDKELQKSVIKNGNKTCEYVDGLIEIGSSKD